MKFSISLLMVIAIALTSCAQQQNGKEQTAEIPQAQTATVKKIKLPVEGMSCSACQSRVKKTLKALPGVSEVEVSLERKMAYVTFDSLKIKSGQLRQAVNDLGYKAGEPEEVKQ